MQDDQQPGKTPPEQPQTQPDQAQPGQAAPQDNQGQAAPSAAPTGSTTEKNPSEWSTGGEPMTGAQASYLKTLSEQAGVDFDSNLSKADASKKIDELQKKTGRGR